nr:hypothetical protein Iba_chr05aCG4260 [Ipomoea batatas]
MAYCHPYRDGDKAGIGDPHNVNAALALIVLQFFMKTKKHQPPSKVELKLQSSRHLVTSSVLWKRRAEAETRDRKSQGSRSETN